MEPTTAQSPPPLAPFTFSPTLSAFNIPMSTYLSSLSSFPSQQQQLPHQGIASGALIFSSSPTTSPATKILILQRAASDSSPNKWEIPGGGVDHTDPTILHGVAREVLEETGLVVRHISRMVGPEGLAFVTRRGLRVVKFAFEVEVEEGGEVKLDKNEHQRFLWAGEEECRDARMGDGYVVEFTGRKHQECILEGFRLRREGM
ncbi:hypothetical protein IFR05_015791 [Cadophora sp. M221]|nr:hypothetical protein IFR05_015791 [Cadophora sp. M221]